MNPNEQKINLKAIVLFSLVLVAIIIVVMLITKGMDLYYSEKYGKLKLSQEEGKRLEAQFPGPRLQTDPAKDLARFKKEEEEILSGYDWVDRKNGIVRIPIEEAMRLTVKRGISSRGEGR